MDPNRCSTFKLLSDSQLDLCDEQLLWEVCPKHLASHENTRIATILPILFCNVFDFQCSPNTGSVTYPRPCDAEREATTDAYTEKQKKNRIQRIFLLEPIE